MTTVPNPFLDSISLGVDGNVVTQDEVERESPAAPESKPESNAFLDSISLDASGNIAGYDGAAKPTSSPAHAGAIDPIAAIRLAAQEAGIDENNLIALAKLETANGAKTIKGSGQDTYNLFNIKDFSKDGSGIRANDKAEGSNDRYRQYSNYLDSARDVIRLLGTSSRYKGALEAKTPEEFATALKRGGYATDENYVSKFVATAGGSKGRAPTATPTANTAQPASVQPATSGPNLLDLLTDDDVRRMASDGSNGLMSAAPAPAAAKDRTWGEAATDNFIGASTGIWGGLKSVSDAFGADNAVSSFADKTVKFLNNQQSAERKAERQNRQAAIQSAEDSGSTWDEIVANVGAFTDAPIEMTLNVLGSSSPTLLASIVPGLGQANAARFILQGAVGTAQGVGAVKGSIYEKVQERLEKDGMSKSEAAKVAAGAQAYDSANAGQIALGGVLGFLGGSTGLEGALGRMTGRAAGEAVEGVARGALARTAIGAAKEATLEGLQGGQERVASNIALQNLGYNEPTFKGAIGQGVGEAVASIGPGAMGGYFDRPAPNPVAAAAQQPNSPLSRAAVAAGAGQQGAAAPQPPAAATAPADELTQRAAAIAALIQGDGDQNPGLLSQLAALDDDMGTGTQGIIDLLDTAKNPAADPQARQTALAALEAALQMEGVALPAAQQAPAGAAPQPTQAVTAPKDASSFSSIFDTDNVYQGWSNVRDGSDRTEMLKLIDDVGAMYANAGNASSTYTPEQLDYELQTTQKWYRSAAPEQRKAAVSKIMGDWTAAARPAESAQGEQKPIYMPGAEVNANREKPKQPRVLQPRQRDSAASVAQMVGNAKNIDWLQVGPSSVLGVGAPVVFGDLPQTAILGDEQMVTDMAGRHLVTRYAIVDASDVIASNTIDGNSVRDYETGLPGKLRAAAGNGRKNTIEYAYEIGTAQNGYLPPMLKSAPSLGIQAQPQALSAMPKPMLVRIMDERDVTDNFGAITNAKIGLDRSDVEQATDDARAFNFGEMAFDEHGAPTGDSVGKFIASLPTNETGNLVTKDDRITPHAINRFMAATFKHAYEDDALVSEVTMEADPDAKRVLDAAMNAAGVMAALKGKGDFDVSLAVADAIRLAINAARKTKASGQRVTLADEASNQDIAISDEGRAVARMLGRPEISGSSKKMAAALRRWGMLALQQARIVEESQYQSSLIQPETLTREQIFADLGSDTNPTDQAVAGRKPPEQQQAAPAAQAATEGVAPQPPAQRQAVPTVPTNFSGTPSATMGTRTNASAGPGFDAQGAQALIKPKAAPQPNEGGLQLNAANKPFSSEGAAKLALLKFGQGRVVPVDGGFAIQLDGAMGEMVRGTTEYGFNAASAQAMVPKNGATQTGAMPTDGEQSKTSYSQRNADRLARVAKAQTQSEFDAITAEEHTDGERHFSGTDGLRMAINSRKNEVKLEASSKEQQAQYDAGNWVFAEKGGSLSGAEQQAKLLQAQDPTAEYRAQPNSTDGWDVQKRKLPEAMQPQAQPGVDVEASTQATPQQAATPSLAEIKAQIAAREKFAPLQAAMKPAKWVAEEGDEPDNTVWHKWDYGRRYTARLNPGSGNMDISVADDSEDVHLASFDASNPQEAAAASSQAIVDDAAQRAKESGAKRSRKNGFAEVWIDRKKHSISPHNDAFVIRDSQGSIVKSKWDEQLFFATEADALAYAKLTPEQKDAAPRPKDWKNFAPQTIKVAQSLGISLRNDDGSYKELPELRDEIDRRDTQAATAQAPSQWEGASGGLATNKDPVNGGIVDVEPVSGKWFAIPNAAGAAALEGFDTKEQASATPTGNAAHRTTQISSILDNGGKVVDGELRLLNGQPIMMLTNEELASIPDDKKDTKEAIAARLNAVYSNTANAAAASDKPADDAQAQTGTQPDQQAAPALSIPAFQTYADSIDWAKARAKELGKSFIAYRASDEYKNQVLPIQEPLYATAKANWDKETAESAAQLQAAMRDAGLKHGDTVAWNQPGPFLSSTPMHGELRLAKNGMPFVHLPDEIAVAKPGGKLGYTKTLRWHPHMEKQATPEAPALSSYTPAEVEAQQAQQEQAAKAEAARKAAEQKQATAEDERKRIAQASVIAADTFELGQDPMDSLTGQKDVFADAAQEEAPSTYINGDKAEYTGKTEEVAGAVFYEVVYVEGRKNGEKAITARAPDGINQLQKSPEKPKRRTVVPQDPGGNLDRFIKVAADSVGKLRKADVDRVLNETPEHYRDWIASYIKQNRSDLAEEVNEVMQEWSDRLESAPAPAQPSLESIFSDLLARGAKKKAAQEAIQSHPRAAEIEIVQEQFHDALVSLMESGRLKVNGTSSITTDNQSCL